MLMESLRVCCVAIVIYTSFVISYQSVFALLALIVSFLLPDKNSAKNSKTSKHSKSDNVDFNKNPLKGKPRSTIDDLDEKQLREINKKICDFVTYDAEKVDSLTRFALLQQQTQCKFAKKARVWGSLDWKYDIDLEENILRTVPTFYKFTCLCQTLGLDGFLYELPGDIYGENVQEFGGAVQRVLQVLSDNDPGGLHCMDKSYIDKPGWVFEFNRTTMFITTFAPFYTESHSRYSFGLENCYILFQPDISFAQHDLPPDTLHTNWDEPQTIRDHIRLAFRNAGRPYKIYDRFPPLVYDIVKPLDEFNQGPTFWWRKEDQFSQSES